MGKTHDVDTPMLDGVLGSNRAHVDAAIDQVVQGDSRKVGMIGLSFEKGTDDLCESPLVTVAEQLIGKRFIEQSIPQIGQLMVSSCEEAVLRVEVRARHRVVDVVGIEAHGAGGNGYSAICW